MKKILGASLIIAIGLSACAQQKKATTTQKTKVTTVAKDVKPTSASQASKVGKISFISLYRSSCYGKCPVYTVEVSQNGNVKYISRMFTKYEGTFEKNVGADKVAGLFKKFEEYRVDTCQNNYKVMIADVPGVHYKMTINGKQMEIKNAHFGPQFLTALADEVDKLAEVDDTWKKTGGPEPKNRQ